SPRPWRTSPAPGRSSRRRRCRCPRPGRSRPRRSRATRPATAGARVGSYTIRAVDPRSVIERVWPGREVAVEPLGGGITNHNFKVTVDGSSYVLRVGGKDTELLGIDRAVEEAAARMAA